MSIYSSWPSGGVRLTVSGGGADLHFFSNCTNFSCQSYSNWSWKPLFSCQSSCQRKWRLNPTIANPHPIHNTLLNLVIDAKSRYGESKSAGFIILYIHATVIQPVNDPIRNHGCYCVLVWNHKLSFDQWCIHHCEVLGIGIDRNNGCGVWQKIFFRFMIFWWWYVLHINAPECGANFNVKWSKNGIWPFPAQQWIFRKIATRNQVNKSIFYLAVTFFFGISIFKKCAWAMY